MFNIRINEKCAFIANTVFGIGLVLTSWVIYCLPANAGAQSLLDPYADISPTQESKSVPNKALKQSAKPLFRQKESSLENPSVSTNDTNKDLSNTATSEKTSIGKNAKSKIGDRDNPSFLSGVKEVQHGYVTSVKAAGGGIIAGSKAAGSKIAAGTKAISSGVMMASQKVFSGSKAVATNIKPAKKEKQSAEIANANVAPVPARPILPPLPGKPLDQVIAENKQRKRLKDVSVVGETKKQGLITSAVGKLNLFHKAKKKPPANLTANNASNITH